MSREVPNFSDNMKSSIVATLGLAVSVHATVQGFDISSYQPSVNFAGAKASGAGFVIIKVMHIIFLHHGYASNQSVGH